MEHYKEQVTTDDDLKQINRYALRELSTDDVFVFSARAITDEPTTNKRIWSGEFQSEAVKRNLWNGIPVLVNHQNDQTLKVGTVYSAEYRAAERATYTKVFVPLDEQGKHSREAVQNGRLRNVSLSAYTHRERQDGEHTVVLPSPQDRILELSFVGAGGCRTCSTVAETDTGSTCHTESATSTTTTEPNPLHEWAQEEFERAQSEFVRVAGFALGTQIKRETYSKLAASLDPRILREVTNDFRRHVESQNKPLPLAERTSANNAGRIKQVLEQLQIKRGK